MNKLSRRALSLYAVDQLLNHQKPSKVAKALVASLAESGRLGEVNFLLSDIAFELENRQILTTGHVTTAHDITRELENKIKKQLKQLTKSEEILLEKHVDKSILGGIKIETSSRVWDETVRRKISELKEVA